VVLIAEAGFSPGPYVTGLLWMQLLMVMFFFVPVAALATLTRSVAQMLLAVLIVALYMIGMAVLSNQIPNSNFSDPSDDLLAPLLIGVSFAVIFLQYARRRTGMSRMLIGGLGVVFLLVLVATPYRAIIAREFPRLHSQQLSPFQLALSRPDLKDFETYSPDENKIEIRLPMHVSGVQPESIVVINGVLVEVEGPNQLQWNSGWQSPGLQMFPETRSANIEFTLKKKAFERMQTSPVKITVYLAFTLFQERNATRFVIPYGRFAMPGVGLCSDNPYSGQINCLAPLKTPSSFLLTLDMSESTCQLGKEESRANPGEVAREWIQGSDPGPAEFGVSPINIVNLYLSPRDGLNSRRSTRVCPQTPVTLSNTQAVSRSQTEMQLDNVQLSDFRLKPIRFGMVLGGR
jgi:hypothetical protein